MTEAISKKARLAIVLTHPIQYYAPVFRLLHQRHIIDIKVFYTWSQAETGTHDPGFGRDVKWDVPLLDGYPYEFVKNESRNPGSHHGKGIINLGLIPKIEAWSPDAVLVYGWIYHSHMQAMRYFKGKLPVLFRGDSTLLDEGFSIRSLLRFVYLRGVYRYVDTAFYPGTNTKAYFKKYGLKEDQLVFAPHAVDNDRFAAPHTTEASDLRASLNIRANDILLLFAGKFEDKKDPVLLLDAFLESDRSNTHLLMIGNGHLEEMLKDKANGHDRVHFMDFQNQTYMPVVYQACDLFCLPSRGPNETWGLAVNEAMASGKAVLVSDKVGCATDLVKDGFNGRIFEHSNKAGLMSALTTLCDSPTELQKYGQNGRKLIKDWSFDHQAKEIEKVTIATCTRI